MIRTWCREFNLTIETFSISVKLVHLIPTKTSFYKDLKSTSHLLGAKDIITIKKRTPHCFNYSKKKPTYVDHKPNYWKSDDEEGRYIDDNNDDH